MNRLTASDLSAMLARDAEGVCRHLLPNGKARSGEWEVGSLDGEAGESLKVRLTANSEKSVGVWSDFATGEAGGDLLDLWTKVRGFPTTGDAMKEVRDYLGVRGDSDLIDKPRKQYKRPDRPKAVRKPIGPVLEYLHSRGLTDETIRAFRVAADSAHLFYREDYTGPAVVFPYLRGDELISLKWQALDRKANGKKRIDASANAEPGLFGWQALDPSAREVVLVEGEIDCLTAHQYGFPSLSVPFGGGKGKKQQWIENEWERMDQFDVIYLALDMDDEGQDATKEIAHRLGESRCRIVELPHKDFNDCLKAGLSSEDLAFRLAAAKPPEHPMIVSHGSIIESRRRMRREPDVGLTLPAGWSDDFRFRPAQVSVWAGYGGHGKTSMLNFVALHHMTNHGEKFCIASVEMTQEEIQDQLVRQGAGTEGYTENHEDRIVGFLSDHHFVFNTDEAFTLDAMFNAFRYAKARWGVTSFIIDPIGLLSGDDDDQNGQKDLVESVMRFARNERVHVHLVAHVRKPYGAGEEKVPTKSDVRGSVSVTNYVHNVLIVWKNVPKENAVSRSLDRSRAEELEMTDKEREREAALMNQGDTRLIFEKVRTGGIPEKKSVPLWFQRGGQHFVRNPSLIPSSIIPDGPLDQPVVTVNEVLQRD